MDEIRCFVAMAFGHEDTDKVYDNLIVPALRDRKVKPIRIDRIEHNDDIDDRIIAELQECDFVIADLTFARPSVYFEAGYAQRKDPVIYISRRDHLSPRADDEFGNYRVHFDLQMKNIIAWSSPDDHGFSKRLKARISKVVAPVLRGKQVEQQSKLENAKFTALSTDRKLRLIERACWSEIATMGYVEVRADKPYILGRSILDSAHPVVSIDMFESSQYELATMISPIKLGIKYKGTAIESVIIHATGSISKRYLDNLHSMLHLPPIYNICPPSETGKLSRLDDHIFILSLDTAPRTRAMASLTSFSYDAKSERYMWKATEYVPEKGIPGMSEIYILPYGPNRLLTRTGRRSFQKYDIKGNQIGRHLHSDKAEFVGRMHYVKRYINIYIISPIKSERSLLEQMKRIAKLNKF